MVKILMVMLGGSLGAVSRYGLSLLAVRLWGPAFPYGTLIANMSGCFMIGLVFALAERSALISPQFRLFFVTGYIGALTTFSTYALESVNTARDGQNLLSLVNILANNLGGLALVFLGLWLGRLR